MSENDIVRSIERLKQERNAILLVHNYQPPEVQDIADFLGDSLGLSREAASTDADLIVFCGVHFMAETAKILSPDKTVVMPDVHAGCPMANMVTPERLVEIKARHPDATVVTYVNSSAAVKAESDYCCTSANALAVVEAIPNDKILFVPDRHLGEYVAEQSDKEFIFWEGFCPVHMKILTEDIGRLREEWPDAEVLVHPECTADVRALADHVLSTTGICKRAEASDAETFVIGTEVGILHRLRRENRGKRFVPASERAVCPNMKLTTLERVLRSLEDLAEEIQVEEDIRGRARRAIDRMVAIG
ncbi:MAG: quinolinate synthase NadA [Armatimonadota bacterium]|jgi:quinolinate synthase